MKGKRKHATRDSPFNRVQKMTTTIGGTIFEKTSPNAIDLDGDRNLINIYAPASKLFSFQLSTVFFYIIRRYRYRLRDTAGNGRNNLDRLEDYDTARSGFFRHARSRAKPLSPRSLRHRFGARSRIHGRTPGTTGEQQIGRVRCDSNR